MKRKAGEIVRRARIKASVSQVLVGRSIGRSQFWISKVEAGEFHIDELTAQKLLEAINRLGEMRKKSRPLPIFEDLALPGRVEALNQAKNPF